MTTVTGNDSVRADSNVTGNTPCVGCREDPPDLRITNRKENISRAWERFTPHCQNCHGDGHRECTLCGDCMPPGRLDRKYCNNTCRANAHKQRELDKVARAAWEAENPAEAAREAAEYEASVGALQKTLGTASQASVDRRKHRKTASHCYQCGDELTGTVWRVLRSHPHSGFPFTAEAIGRAALWAVPVDEKCLEEWYGETPHRFQKPAPCENCGREVRNRHNLTTNYDAGFTRVVVDGRVEWKEVDRWVYCSPACRNRIATERVKAKRQENKPDLERKCPSCHRDFTPKRSDGRYCSPACRQKAYRQRKRDQ